MKRTLALAVAIILPLVVGCKSDPASSTTDPTANNSNNNATDNTQQYTGTNGFVINGNGMNNVTFNADSVRAQSGTLSFITSTSVFLYGTLNGQPVHLEVNANGQATTGTFNWDGNALASGFADIFINGSIDDGYKNGVGSTTITRLGAVGELVEGSFSGTLKLVSDGTKTVKVNGKFSARRS
jgi:hypothetical protein